MDRIGFVTSMLLSFCGILLLSIGLLVQAILLKVGHIMFNIHGGRHSPNDYSLGVTFDLQQYVAVCCIVWGVVLQPPLSTGLTTFIDVTVTTDYNRAAEGAGWEMV
jgi:hypothetical protein